MNDEARESLAVFAVQLAEGLAAKGDSKAETMKDISKSLSWGLGSRDKRRWLDGLIAKRKPSGGKV